MTRDSEEILYSALNSREIETLVQELDLSGSKIEQIYQDDYEECVLLLYKNKKKNFLTINLSKYSHLYMTNFYQYKKNKPLRFKELLTSKIKNSIILSVQTFSSDRSVVFHVKRHQQEYYLVLLLWANKANIYLCTMQWQILDTFYRKKDNLADKQLQTFLIQEKTKECNNNTIRFTKNNGNLNNTIVKNYTRIKAQEASKLSSEAVHLSKQLKNYQEQLAQLESLDNSEDLWKIEESKFFSQVFASPEAYQLAWDKFYEAKETFYRQIKNKEKRISLINTKMKKIEEKLDSSSGDRKTSDSSNKKSHLHFIYLDYSIIVGRNAKENSAILSSYTRGLDYWLHIHQAKGGFVVIKYQKNKELPPAVLDAGKVLAHYYSKARDLDEVEILFTQVKELKRTKIMGQVEVHHGKTLYHRKNNAILENLLNNHLISKGV